MTTLRSRITALALLTLPRLAAAQGPLGGGGGVDLRGAIISITQQILTYVSLIAVIVIIIAGIWLIVGFGEESAKERAKKIVIYTIVGLILILIANAIVNFVISVF